MDYSAYFGGSSDDGGTDIAVDTLGRMYVTGTTSSPSLPIVGNSPAGLQDAFILKVFPENEPWCHWAFSPGSSKLLYYAWGSGLTTPGTAWRTAFQSAIQNWNSAGTNFTLLEDNAINDLTLMLYDFPDGKGGKTDITCTQDGSTMAHANVMANTTTLPAPVVGVPAHELGHGQGLGHVASDSALMRYDTGGFNGPQALDIELHHQIYP